MGIINKLIEMGISQTDINVVIFILIIFLLLFFILLILKLIEKIKILKKLKYESMKLQYQIHRLDRQIKKINKVEVTSPLASSDMKFKPFIKTKKTRV